VGEQQVTSRGQYQGCSLEAVGEPAGVRAAELPETRTGRAAQPDSRVSEGLPRIGRRAFPLSAHRAHPGGEQRRVATRVLQALPHDGDNTREAVAGLLDVLPATDSRAAVALDAVQGQAQEVTEDRALGHARVPERSASMVAQVARQAGACPQSSS
jgi:hypothetical protein